MANGRTHNAKLIYVDKKLSLTQTTYVTQTKRARTAIVLLAVAVVAVGCVDRNRPRYHVKSLQNDNGEVYKIVLPSEIICNLTTIIRFQREG